MASSSTMMLLCALLSTVAIFCSAQLSSTDTAVLNFALNLEYLEANFYHCAAYGSPIPEDLWRDGNNTGGVAPIGCPGGESKLSRKALEYATEIADDELGHVRLLKAVLGTAAVAQPLIDIGSVFSIAANAAANTTLSPVFDPYANDLFFYHGAFIFEDVGVTAYAGAARLLENKDILTGAAQILAVEAYHAGTIRTLLYQNKAKKAFKNPKLLVRQVVEAISDLRDAVDGVDDIDQGIVTVMEGERYPYSANIVPTDDVNHVVYTRTTDQVLRIVYLGGATSGGFFPQGLNGDVK